VLNDFHSVIADPHVIDIKPLKITPE
jgi:hypothetical protein